MKEDYQIFNDWVYKLFKNYSAWISLLMWFGIGFFSGLVLGISVNATIK